MKRRAAIDRMSYACYLVALELGFEEHRAIELRKASSLHDIGKIGIPDQVLLKDSRLDAEEWQIMQSHTTIGLKILGQSESSLIQTARIVIASHHEKWDGAGYPVGLKGDDIPLEGRIAAICDVFDALISDRPYKKAWTYSDALKYIEDRSGTQFDPKVVHAFMTVYPEIVQYSQENQ